MAAALALQVPLGAACGKPPSAMALGALRSFLQGKRVTAFPKGGRPRAPAPVGFVSPLPRRRSLGPVVACSQGAFSKSTASDGEKSSNASASLQSVKDMLANFFNRFSTPAAAVLLALGLSMGLAGSAGAAQTGGRLGGRNFRSAAVASSRSSKSSSSKISSGQMGNSLWDSSLPKQTFGRKTSGAFALNSWSPLGFFLVPTYGVGYSTGPSFSTILFVVLAAAAIYWLVSQNSDDDYEEDYAPQRVSVLRLQVGLLALARGLQQDLDRVGTTADTSTPEGLQYVLEETVLSINRNPQYFSYGYTSYSKVTGMDVAEQKFNALSLEERAKFKEETLVNVDSRVSNRGSTSTASAGTGEYIVVTILVAADGNYDLPQINSTADLRVALNTLGSVPADSLQAVEVLWTPQDPKDTLSSDQVLADYPQLRNL